MGLDGIVAMVDEFDLINALESMCPTKSDSRTPAEFKKFLMVAISPGKTCDTVVASFGQVYEEMTPINMLRSVAGIGLHGKLYVPHFLKELKPVGQDGTPEYRQRREFQPFDSSRPNPKIVSIPGDINQAVVEGMWGVVNNGGTGAGIRMVGFEIAGKTGTAQVVGLGKDIGKNKDHSWFVSYAPAYKPELSVIALIENSGFGGHHAAPAVRKIYDAYYRKTRHEEPPGAVPVAKTTKAARKDPQKRRRRQS